MPITKRPAKRIVSKTLEKMKQKKKTEEFKKKIGQLQKGPTLEQQAEIDKFNKKLSTLNSDLRKLTFKKNKK